MQKKFALTNEPRVFNNKTLYRIRALKDFDDVKTGDLGGFIEKEANLSHDGNCWVYDKACVYGYAVVSENAKIRHFLKFVVKSMGIVKSMARLSSLNTQKFMTMLVSMAMLMFMGMLM